MKNLVLFVSFVCYGGGLTMGVLGDPERNQPGFGVSIFFLGGEGGVEVLFLQFEVCSASTPLPLSQ